MKNLIEYEFDCMFFPPLGDGSIDFDSSVACYLLTGETMTRDELFSETFSSEHYLYVVPLPNLDIIKNGNDMYDENSVVALFEYIYEHQEELLENTFMLPKTYH